MVSKTFLEKIAAGVLASSILLPAFAFAQVSSTTPTTPKAGAVKLVCSNIENMRTKALARLTARVTEVQGKKGDRQAKFEAGRTDRHAKLDATRTQQDAVRQTRYTKLMSHASTSDQKAAVTTFQTEVERLVTVRKAAVDDAIKTFEDGVLALQTANETKVTDFSTTMQADINKIFDDAAASCSAGKSGQEIMTQIKAAMEAKKAARDSDKAAHTPGEQFKALQATRKASVDTAMAAFKTGFTAATTELKKSFTK